MKNQLSFDEVKREALLRAHELMPRWLPGGSFKGDEYVCSDIRGGQGTSLKFNIKKGFGEDFGIGEKYGDMIALYAKIYGLSNNDAKRAIEIELGIAVNEQDIGMPPPTEKPPVGLHYKYGAPKEIYPYRTVSGQVSFYICRYEDKEGKTFLPYAWDKTNRHWVTKGVPWTKSLYRVERLSQNPKRPVLIVEGEKACHAAQRIVGERYNVVTWAGGAAAVKKSDWSPLYNKSVLIWPDGDEPGMKAAHEIKDILLKKNSKDVQVKILRTILAEENLRGPFKKGWDAADMFWDWNQFYLWGKNRIDVFTKNDFKEIAPHETSVEKVKEKKLQKKKPEPTHINVNYQHNQITESPLITGANISSITNIFRSEEKFKKLFWFDEFHQKRFIEKNGHGPVEWDEIDDTYLCYEIQTHYAIPRASIDCVRQAAMMFAMENVRNEPRDWLKSLNWDHTSRIEKFLVDYMGVTENSYTLAVSRNFWISLVARIMNPGCKCDTMMILEGKQGTKKSSAIAAIGGKFYAQSHDSVTTKDFYQNLQGKFIVEIGELDAFQKAEVNAIKRCLSTPVDRMRTSYSRYPKDFPRQSIFVGTTNDTNYLSDSTGNRRFWPIATKAIDLDRIEKDREQLFAEAVIKFKLGCTWYEVPRDLAEREQMEREIDDAWADDVRDYCIGKTEVSMRDIIVSGLKMEISKASKRETNRIGKILRSIGFINRASREYGVVTKRWVKEESE